MTESDNASVSFAICRICHSGEHSIAYDKSRTVGEPLISPCFCRGTIGLYHRSCLERWLESSSRRTCEICHFTYQTTRRYRTFCEFIIRRDCQLERRNLVVDITCFVFLTPIVIGCIILCFSSSAAQTRGFRLWSSTAGCQAISLLILSAVLSVTYLVWVVITIVFHIKTYLDWRIHNEEVFVVDQQLTSTSKTFSAVRKYQGARRQMSAMRLLCFDLRTLLHDLFRKDLSRTTTNDANPVHPNSATHGRQGSIISSNELNISYDDFVRHLHPEDSSIHLIGPSQYKMASTPVLSTKVTTHLQIFEYPSVNSAIPETPRSSMQ